MTRLECIYSVADTSWCMKYRVSFGVSFLRFFTISLIVFAYTNIYLVLAQFQNDVNEFGVFKDAIKFYNISLMKSLMDFDL